MYCKVFSNVFYGSRYILSAVFDFIKTIVQWGRSGPPEIWQDHQISRASGPMVHCLEMLISSPGVFIDQVLEHETVHFNITTFSSHHKSVRAGQQ